MKKILIFLRIIKKKKNVNTFFSIDEVKEIINIISDTLSQSDRISMYMRQRALKKFEEYKEKKNGMYY